MFPDGGGLAQQIYIDLGQLNKDTPLADGSYPLRTWLRNAWNLANVGQRPEGQVFRKAMIEVDRVLAAKEGGTAMATDLSGALAPWTADDVRYLVARRLTARTAELGAKADTLDLVKAAAQGNWLDLLLLAALNQHPGEADLVRFAAARKLIPDVPLKASALQRIVKQQTPFTDVALWRAKLACAEATVARVEINVNGMWKPNGTAFLVGPDMVMTNHHVVKSLLDEENVVGKLRFRFDFKRITDGARPLDGTLVDPAEDDWCGPHAPPSAVDEMADPAGREPGDDELDFAIIHLASKVGDLPIGASDASIKGAPRGWLAPVKDTALAPLVEKDSVFLLEHPDGDALQIAAGAFLEVGARRVRYDANAVNGSSGSPVFNARLDLVALHHAGDPNFAALHRPTYNQGIPMHLIVAKCEAEGVTFPAPPG